jgi:hypothetical protein
MTPNESNKLKQQMLAKMLAASLGAVSTPAEVDALMREFREQMAVAVPGVLSEQNPFSRIAAQTQKGMATGDAVAQELYARDEKIEARAWLREGVAAKKKRLIHTYSPRKSEKLVEELYAAGARTVSIVDPEMNSKMETSDVLIVVLPESPEHRHALAQIHQREMSKVWCFEPEGEAETSTGEHLVFQYT